jgi:hypothetical protein
MFQNKRLKIGFLVDDLVVSTYIFDLIKHISESDCFHSPVIIHDHQQEKKSSKLK